MNYSLRQLYALGEPLGESATRLKLGGRIYGGGGGGGGLSFIEDAVGDLAGGAGDIVEGVVGGAGDVLSEVVGGVGDVVEGVVGGVGDAVGDVVGGVGDAVGDLGNSIDDFVADTIPGGWTTLAEVAMAFTPLGPMGSAGVGALSGATNKGKGGFNLQGAIMGGLQGYGVGSLATSLASAGAPNPYGSGAEYDITTATGPEAFNPPVEVGSMPATDYSLASSTPPTVNTAGVSPVDYGLSNAASSGINPVSSAQVGYTPTGEIGYTQSAINPGQLPGGSSMAGIQNASFGAPPSPSGLEGLGSSMIDKAAQTGQGIKNLTGFGPEGISGIMPAASAVNAGMSTASYSGLGLLAMQTIAEKEAEKLQNDERLRSGSITNEEYQKNQVMIDEAIARARETVSLYPYEPDPEKTTQQEALYPRSQKTLYDNYGLQNLNSQEVLYDKDSELLYADGGAVDGYETPDTLKAGGITSGFDFKSGSQMPMYAMGGEIPAYGIGGYARGGEPRFLSGGGDGMSDSIRANIDGKQEARLADGEFVIPADVVSHLGNGSSKAGAKQLYAMMNRIRKARTGNPKQGKQINPTKFMPA